jgi:hypothetical protein
MLQIVKTVNTEIKAVALVDSRDKFYGVKTTKSIRRFIRRTEYEGKFELFALTSFTNSNGSYHSGTCNTDSLMVFINYLINLGYEVYEFDKLSELAVWLEEC